MSIYVIEAIIKAAMIICFSVVGIAVLYYAKGILVDEYRSLPSEEARTKFKFTYLITILGLFVVFVTITLMRFFLNIPILIHIHNWLNRY